MLIFIQLALRFPIKTLFEDRETHEPDQLLKWPTQLLYKMQLSLATTS